MLEGTGWIPDEYDRRDYTPNAPPVRKIFRPILAADLPRKVDIRASCPPIRDQGDLGSCTAHAVVGAMETLEKTFKEKTQDYSELFEYFMARRRIAGLVGDTGVSIRDGIKAAAQFGIALESCWPYLTWRFDIEPDACIDQAKQFQALTYVSLYTVHDIKATVNEGLPVCIGFSVFDNLAGGPDVPLPYGYEEIGGHAVLIVGYDDDYVIDGNKGAFIFRNSWGKDWGEDGYGYLPYWYFENDCASDFWVILTREYLEQPVELSFWDKVKNFIEEIKSWLFQLFRKVP